MSYDISLGFVWKDRSDVFVLLREYLQQDNLKKTLDNIPPKAGKHFWLLSLLVALEI